MSATENEIDTGEVERLRRELAQAQAEIESLGKRLALRERERDLQRQFDAYKERKRKEQEDAQTLRNLYNDLLFENNPNTLFLFDEKLRYVLGSHRFLIRALPEDLVGKPLSVVFSECLDSEWLQKVQRQCGSVMETQQLWRYNDKLHLGGESPIDVQVIISPVTQEDGRNRGVLIAINDVSELAEARQRAEEADRMKSEFLAQMSHEIRTPMNAIVGIAEILLHDRELTLSQRKYVSDIKVSSNALLTIINDILDFSKLNSGRMALTPIHFDFRLLVDNICSLMSYMTSEKGIGFSFETRGDLPRCLYGDDVRLRQVLLNLLSNAVKFTSEGRVSLLVAVSGDSLAFHVTDTGMGIKPADQAGLFEPFRQANKQLTRHIQGTGLGLSICRSLVDLMGGEIGLESEYGRGSTFRVVLPKVIGDPAQLSTQGGGTNDVYSDEAKLLVVDDNEINLTVASGLLRTLHGLYCDTALSGEEALSRVKETEYDLIFMDHMMPGMDGVETASLIRLLGGHNATVPIVALTANAVAGAREMLLATSMNDFLAKPINKQELAGVLRRWLPEGMCLESTPVGGGEGVREVEYLPVLQGIRGIGAIDFDAGLAGLGGDQESYERSLRLLSRKIPDVNARMEEDLFSRDDVGAFCIQVHGMKSSLASVGAGGLSRMALGLEKLAQGGDGKACRTDFPAFSAQLLGLGRELEGVFREFGEVAGEREVADGAKLEEVLKGLRVALGTYDYDAVVEGLQDAMGLDFGEERNRVFGEVKELVEEFDYSTALDRLNGLS